MKKLTERMEEVMWYLAMGHEASAGCNNRSEYGGLTKVLMGLRQRGLIDINNELTPHGESWNAERWFKK